MAEQRTVAEQLEEKDKQIKELQELLDKGKEKGSKNIEQLEEQIQDLREVIGELQEQKERESEHIEEVEEAQHERNFWEPW